MSNLIFGVSLYENADFSGGIDEEIVGWNSHFGPGKHTGDFPDDVAVSYKVDERCCATFFQH
jgi:hypothetical protein